MRVVALMTVRNEELYLERCLQHLYDQGIQVCLIDNGSSDRTLEIAESFQDKCVIRIEQFPYNGSFELEKILKNEERLSHEIEADWFIHHDADEIREAPHPYKTLLAGIEAVDREGYNAINFDEFVFVPTNDQESFVGKDYVAEMQYYYYFAPRELHRLNAWKKTKDIDLHTHAGHRVQFVGQKNYPEAFILRHYIALSKTHIIRKYGGRIYSKSDIENGWFVNRIFDFSLNLNMPPRDVLKKVRSEEGWDRSEPQSKHKGLNEAARFTDYVEVKNYFSVSKNTKLDYPAMPIIVGFPCSGATLLRLMLDAHPKLAIPSETHFIQSVLQIKQDALDLRKQFFDILTGSPQWNDFHIPEDIFWQLLLEIQPFEVSDGLRTFYRLYADRHSKSLWGEKTSIYMPDLVQIQRILPEAYFIHIIRDGRDAALSMSFSYLKEIWEHRNCESDFKIQNVALRWQETIQNARQQAQFCNHYLEVRYETLVQRPKETLEQVCKFIDLPYSAEMLNYHQTSLTRLDEFSDLVFTDTLTIPKSRRLFTHRSTQKPPDPYHIGRWKTHISRTDQKEFESIAGATLRELNYELQAHEETLAPLPIPEVTLVVVPRERFSHIQRSLENLYVNTTLPFFLIYVDGNSPSPIKEYLHEQANLRNFHLVQADHFLSPNQARALGLTYVQTPYTVFLDNDLLVAPGWLEALIQCARETNADVVSPLTLKGEFENQLIHVAGGTLNIEERNGKHYLNHHLRFNCKRIQDLEEPLEREQTELAEFHCMLLKTRLFERIGLPEDHLSNAAYRDLCLSIQSIGGSIYFEPSAVVTYIPPEPLEIYDIPYFLQRWQEDAIWKCMDKFYEKWNLDKADPAIAHHYQWMVKQRLLAYQSEQFYNASKRLRVVALLTVRNEELYIRQCLEHLISQEIEVCLIDNGSVDRTIEIAQAYLNKGVCRIEALPFLGYFDLQTVLRNEERLALEIDADWFIHHDADEIRQAPVPYRTLREGIEDVDRQGYNAINFDEYIFLPTQENQEFEREDYVKGMKHYLFHVNPLQRINAWKKTTQVDLHTKDGHQAIFPDRRIFSTHFVLRHYIFLSKRHAIAKYANRVNPRDQLMRGHPKKRAGFAPQKLSLPKQTELKAVSSINQWDKSEPKDVEFLGLNSEPDPQHDYIAKVAETYAKFGTLIPPFVHTGVEPMPFVIGNPRSGTTLLRTILDSHPDLAFPPETHFVPQLLALKQEDSLRDAFFQTVTGHRRWAHFHLSKADLYEQLLNIQPFTTADGLRSVYQMYANRFGKKRWGDKTPNYALHMYQIQSVLPEAHFIHIIRDGRDAALSLKGLWFDGANTMEERAFDWMWRIREARQQAQICAHYLEVRYEALITNTVPVLKEICDFIQIPYRDEMQDYYRSAGRRLDEITTLVNADGSIHESTEQIRAINARVECPPDSTRIGRWRREMSLSDRQSFEAAAGVLLQDLGYELGGDQALEPLASSNLDQVSSSLVRSHSWLNSMRSNLENQL